MIESYAQAIADLAKKGAVIAKEKGILAECGKMCGECAFNMDQPHTLEYAMAADAAAIALMAEGQFNCHTAKYEDAGKLCAGFKFAKLVYGE